MKRLTKLKAKEKRLQQVTATMLGAYIKGELK